MLHRVTYIGCAPQLANLAMPPVAGLVDEYLKLSPLGRLRREEVLDVALQYFYKHKVRCWASLAEC